MASHWVVLGCSFQKATAAMMGVATATATTGWVTVRPASLTARKFR